MSEAKRRKKEIEALKADVTAWKKSLDVQEKEILDLAVKLDEKLVRGMKFYEGCYHLAFFMSKYLHEIGIKVKPVIGWVNDGTWDGVASHAWIEYQGKKTDVSLGYTLRPDAQPTGSMIVHDRPIRKGMAMYCYFRNDDKDALERLEKLRADPQFSRMVMEKDAQHRYMLSIAESGNFDTYLSQAPAGLRYHDICELLKH